MEDEPLPLREQCFLHLVSHVVEYSPQELALLPVHYRRALLRVIAPVHLYHLEQTAVVNGINTDAIWTEIYQLQTGSVDGWNWCPARVVVLDSYKDGLRARYLTYIWHKLLGDLGESNLGHRNNHVMMPFATHTKMLKESTAEFLKTHTQPWFVPVMLNRYNKQCEYLAPTHCLVTSESEAVACLIKMGALPRVLDLRVDYIESSALWKQKENQILQQLLQNSQLRKIKMDFLRGDPSVGSFILQTVLQSVDLTLQSLELLNLHIKILSPLVPLSTPECYSGLKDLHAELRTAATTTGDQYHLFASIVAHQTALESFYISQLGCFPVNTEGERFISALTSLLGQPQFRRLKLCWCEGLPLAALQSITEAFMSSSPQSEQHLTFVSLKVLSPWQSLLHSRRYSSKPHLSVSAEHAATFGPRKHLSFQYSHIPCAFLKWFCEIKRLCLNSLEFIRCRTDNSKCTIREHFEQHPNFSVQYFRCT